MRSTRFAVTSMTLSLDEEGEGLTDEALYHRLMAVVYQLCGAIVECEAADFRREEILAVLELVRQIHAASPFVNRLQTWPRGYPGDFETVEYLIGGAGANRVEGRLARSCGAGANRAEGRLARSCEAYALSRSIAQQHRNKIHHQAARLMRTFLAKPARSRVASIACGSFPTCA
jgi:extracellular factor (EF) 3-hydroxypalmitic acid methyl ester biosynthesis protein